ncbi:MAG TPA: c-type cytochrome biogenesis protein CcmI [Pyrinomonadaceae bacterium]|nr:c-type cytochrome biogenesis protein CcmI [Pyrinomonadaceae bacterium]
MILFWLTCAAFVAVALAFVVPPLLAPSRKDQPDDNEEANVEVYRDQISELEADLQNGIISQEQYQQDRDEIERRLLADVAAGSKQKAKTTTTNTDSRAPAYAIALAMPVISLGAYFLVGNPAAMTGVNTAPVQAPFADNARRDGPAPPMSQGDIEANVASLAKRMEQNPGDAAGWTMLGRSFLTLQKFDEAAGAYGKAAALKPNDADAWADYAFAMGMANGKSLLGQPSDLIKKALALDPENPKGLELAGSAAYEAKNYQEAINFWERLQKKTPGDSELGQALAERIQLAKAGLKGGK